MRQKNGLAKTQSAPCGSLAPPGTASQAATGAFSGQTASRSRAMEASDYCQARKRLPEKFYSDVALKTGQALDDKSDDRWLWKGRRVLAYDGSTLSMPDTPENQKAYPQPPQQQPRLGFPLMRIAAFFSLSCGAVLELGMCSNSDKGHSELGMLRQLWDRPLQLVGRGSCSALPM